MWLATKHGFYSIVCAHGPDGKPHPELMMIRARKHSHLVNLQRFHDDLGLIRKSEGTDYPYRIFAGRDVVLSMVARLAAEIYYDNFKGVVTITMPKDAAYKKFLHSVWGLGLRLTPARVCRASFFCYPDEVV